MNYKSRNLRCFAICLMFVMLLAASCCARDYYVKSNGSDGADGKTLATAWKSIDRGDALYELQPGDIVHVMAGDYSYTDATPGGTYDAAVVLSRCPGAAGNPIIYKAEGQVNVNVAGGDLMDSAILIKAGYIVLDGFNISGSWAGVGIMEAAAGREVRNCCFTGDGNGIYVDGQAFVHNNLFLSAVGARVDPTSDGSVFYNNTFATPYYAICKLPWATSNRVLTVKNNIFANIGNSCVAIELPNATLTHTNNTFYNCAFGLYYEGGVLKTTPTGASENTDDPKFTSDYHLMLGSPCIDSGADVGLAFLGTAPDRGAFEGAVLPAPKDYYVKPDGNDNADGRTPATAWKSIDRGDVLYALQPGDTVHVMAGNYSATDPNPGAGYDQMVNIIRCSGTADRPITYVAEGDVTLNFAAINNFDTALRVDSAYVVLDGFKIGGGWSSIGLYGTAAGRVVRNCTMTATAGAMYIDAPSLIHHNLFVNEAGVRVGPGSNGTAFYNNTFACVYWAIGKLPWEPSDRSLIVKNNIFANYANGSPAINLADATLTHANNTFYNCPSGVYSEGGDLMFYPTGAGEDTNDPMFVGNYHLSTSSPCIDSGVEVGLPFAGTAPDRGAFEIPAAGADAGTVSGLVKDAKTGAVIESATITVVIDGLDYPVQTDADGYYSVLVSPGEQIIKAEAAYYNPTEKSVNVPAYGNLTVDFDLTWGRDFYVKPDGNDNADGKTSATAWKTIDRGDALNILQPGDTIHVMAGTYNITDPTPDRGWGVGVNLNTSGAPDKPITYKAEGDVKVVFHESASVPYEVGDYNYQDYVFQIKANYITLDGFEVSGCAWTDVFVSYVNGTVVKNCHFKDFLGVYIAETGDGCRVERNFFERSCAVMEAGNAEFYNNTFVDPMKLGLEHAAAINEWPWGSHDGTITVVNNIFAYFQFSDPENTHFDGLGIVNGTKAAATMTSSHNTFFNCTGGAYYSGGTLCTTPIGANENTVNPMFVGSGNYALLPGSPCVDAGAVVAGIGFNGSAPDRGAFESSPVPTFETGKVGDLLNKADGQPVSLTSCVVTAGTGIFAGNIIYVEDESRAAGIRVQVSSESIPVDEGCRIKVGGAIATQNGMKAIVASSIEFIDTVDALAPLGMNGKSLDDQGTSTKALLVKVWGKVNRIPGVTAYFCLDDGSGRTDGNGHVGLPVVVSQTSGGVTLPADGAYISVTGISGSYDFGSGLVAVVFPRGTTDLN